MRNLIEAAPAIRRGFIFSQYGTGDAFMAITIYDATVAAFIQTTAAIGHLLKRGRAHCEESAIDLTGVLDSRVHPNMLPFRYQVQAVIGHTVGAVEGVKGGLFKPPSGTPTADWDALEAAVAGALDTLKSYTPDDINALEESDVVFNVGEHKLAFTGAGFLMTFSVPNMHFHATTAYDLLRAQGVPLGKGDYLGRIKLKT
jgi:hypothetical protein